MLKRIAEAIADGQGVFFVGAGLSVAAGAPSWDELVKPLRERLTPRSNEPSNQLVAQYYRNQYGAIELHKQLRMSLPANLQPTPAHDALCQLPVPIYVTTNYDDLLEAAFRRVQRPVHVIRDNAEVAFWSEREEVQLFKIHGDLSSSKDIVLTERDYVRFLAGNELIRNKLRELFTCHNVIFVGYSLRDPDVSLIHNTIAYELGELKRPTYIITFDQDPHRQREWQQCGIVPVCLESPPKSGVQTAMLHALLRDISQATKRANRSRREILVVEDDPDVCKYVERVIRSHLGWRVLTARDGIEAQLLLGVHQPLLLILDLRMPRKTGVEVIAAMRKIPDLADTRVLVISGYPDECPPEMCEELGVDRILAKPVHPDELVKTVKQILGNVVTLPPPPREGTSLAQHEPMQGGTLAIPSIKLPCINECAVAVPPQPRSGWVGRETTSAPAAIPRR